MKSLFLFYKKLIYKSRYWLYFIVALAVVWAGFAFLLAISFPATYPAFIGYLGEMFGEILGDLDPDQKFELAQALFKQNFIASFLDISLGIAFGLVSIISITVNFFALGFLAAPAVAPQTFDLESISLLLFAMAILPHGIFEIPAILLSAAFGMRIGWHWLLPSSSGKRKKILKESVIDAVKIIPLVLVLLIIAAAVEVYVTGWIIGI